MQLDPWGLVLAGAVILATTACFTLAALAVMAWEMMAP